MPQASHLAAPSATATGSGLTDTERATVDAALDGLRRGARTWRHLTLSQRARLCDRLHDTIAAGAEEWADAASRAKGLDPGHPSRGEEWLSGPYAALVATAAYARTLRTLARGASPLDDVALASAPGGRVRAHVFPGDLSDRLVLSGYTAEVWFTPGTTAADARRRAGLAQRDPQAPGGVGLVLGAGNITSIPVQDVFTELLAHNRVVLLKLNPLQDALLPILRQVLAPLIAGGYLRIVRGGGAVGAHLTAHSGIDHVHITGAAETFDAIVWGPPSGATTRRRREGRPKLKVPISAELGGVSPIIVVPGRWSAADLRFQAEHIATMRLHNAGHNCIAGQVVILSADWPQRNAFLKELRRALAAAPARPVWYPSGATSVASAAASFPHALRVGGERLLVELRPDDDATPMEQTEYFAPVLGVQTLAGDGQEFLDRAVAYANDRLAGSLGANLLIDPETERALGSGFEEAVAALRYGAIAINTWTGFVFLTPTLTWNAFPGGTLADIGSGTGVVHNALLLDDVERSIGRAPFRPFPRSLPTLLPGRAGIFSVLPKPPWFVGARTGASVSAGFTRFRARGGLRSIRAIGGLVPTFLRALRA
ncbi:aldehyde dehydrogenase family protein [Microbacterium aurantiacum]|uniref:Aldehyde dehydrogenase n=1 Tax=Microbacterium aurantiacum TaxID=162393 RepID=A0A0M8MR41_9MICO|nr:aldehyde dehydrogenase family protein [Microbacterium chocolatum]KOS12110.1 aldehyde dehydrogenase [Microbacterium chocolatum]